jgi:pSer/pThr/pTyr-binding forkhead associated (FHA) protein
MDTTHTRQSSPQQEAHEGRPYLMIIGGARVGELLPLTGARTLVGRSPEAQIRLGDDGVSRAHAEILLDDGRVRVRDLGSTNGTFLNGVRTDARDLHDGDKLSIGEATLLLFTHSDGLEAGYQRGRFLTAVRDPGTTALKRDVFLERLAQEVSYARRHGAALTVLVWELDGLTTLEAQLGAEGLRESVAAAAGAARGGLPDDDLLGALAPGRFAVACRETDQRVAGERAARLRAAVAAATLDRSVRLAASVGVAWCHDAGSSAEGGSTREKTTEAAKALLADAEAALASARTAGGDRVAFADR